jgi:hypothetical protein
MNKLNLHAALFLCTGLLTGLTLILNANLKARLDQLPGAEATTAPTPTQTPASYNPILYISFREGAPGSIFTLTGLSYRDVPNNPVTILVNGRNLGSLDGSQGWFVFLLNTKDAEDGLYMVHVQTPDLEKTEFFRLDPNEPLRQPINSGPEYMIPAGIDFTKQELLPAVLR